MTDLVLVMSAETFAELPAWHEPERLLELARVAVVPTRRLPGAEPAWLDARFPGAGATDRRPRRPAPRHLVDGDPRAASRAGRSIRYLVPEAVERVYRRPWPLPNAQSRREDSQPIVTDPARRRGPAERRRPAPSQGGRAGPPATRPSLDLARRIVELAEDKKAADIVLLDLAALTTLADYFVICSGGSERQLDAIADGIICALRDERIQPIGREGTPASHWVLLDFGSVIVHVFTPPERDYYQLEKHWAEAKTILRVQ